MLDKTNKENERVMLLINISEFINKLEDIKLKELIKYLERKENMKKSYIFILIIILMITLVIINQKKNNKSFVVDGVRYSTSLDGNSIDSFPSKGDYEVEVNCINAKGSWNYSKWVARINNITGKVSCNISFTSKTPTNINDYIKGLVSTEQGTGQVVNENGYRYEGKNPNNYIYFNDELWRIIGVFDSSSHGKTGEYLTKIIRNDSLGGYVWNKSAKNNWATSSLYNLLNTNYYNATDGTSGSNCYQSSIIKGNCDYTETGLQDEYKNMAENVTWYLGGKNSTDYTSEAFYTGERDSTSVYSGNTASITGYIGLMYVSDYGYSVLSSSCARTTNLGGGGYNTSACGGSSWLKKESNEWTVTHRTASSSTSFFLNSSAYLGDSFDANAGLAIRPVLYLKSGVQVYAGDGSISKPYQVKLAS